MGLAGAAASFGLRASGASAEPPPETKRIRLGSSLSLCYAPQFVAEPLLRSEGFTEVEYVEFKTVPERAKALATGRLDLTMTVSVAVIQQIDAGDPIVVLSGVHTGCYELFGNERVRKIRDLKGKAIGVSGEGASETLFLASMMAYVGLDPRRDVRWITNPPAESMRRFADGTIDAYMAFPPEPQELRAKKIGHVIVNTAADPPWSQHFCCMAAANKGFVQKHPVAAKRALRALLKAANLCAREPERVAQTLVDKGRTPRYDVAVQALRDIPFAEKWREYDPEATLRFHALRLHEIGWVRSNPNQLIADGADWRFLNELKKELKG
jgi:NitT/TauT family transport system substrate-binding protein